MSIFGAVILGLSAQAVPAAIDVAHEDLVAGRDAAAIEEIMNNEALDAGDPARAINLGIAHARRGEVEQARRLFDAVLEADEALYLETAQGDWIEARKLAARALTMLERGDFARRAVMASR